MVFREGIIKVETRLDIRGICHNLWVTERKLLKDPEQTNARLRFYDRINS